MTTIRKILCAIDLTKASRNAFDRALSIARVSKAKLYILHAVPAWRFHGTRANVWNFSPTYGNVQSAKAWRFEQSNNMAIQLEQSCCMPTRKADLVVLGSNRRRGWQRFREGSVGERVLRRAAWAVADRSWDAPPRKPDRKTTAALVARSTRDHEHESVMPQGSPVPSLVQRPGLTEPSPSEPGVHQKQRRRASTGPSSRKSRLSETAAPRASISARQHGTSCRTSDLTRKWLRQ